MKNTDFKQLTCRFVSKKMDKKYNFPAYRSYSDGLTWFKLESPTLFTELKLLGKYYSLTRIEADKHPERMFIQDLLNCEFESIKTATENQFEGTLDLCKKQLTHVEF
jgi:hypothetical protein